MRNICEPEVMKEVFHRLDELDHDTPGLWGKMTVTQMLKHCRLQIGLGTGAVKSKGMYPGFVQWLAKQTFGFRIPWSKNLPSAPAMVSTKDDGLDFSSEMTQLKEVITSFAALPDNAKLSGHPIFGQMTKAEWGQIIYKHLDHHLGQFGE